MLRHYVQFQWYFQKLIYTILMSYEQTLSLNVLQETSPF